MAVIIEDEEQFKKLAEQYQEALDYIKYLEGFLDAAVYQEQEYNKKFTKDENDG